MSEQKSIFIWTEAGYWQISTKQLNEQKILIFNFSD